MPFAYHRIDNDVENCWRDYITLRRAAFGLERSSVVALLSGNNGERIPDISQDS
jgi:hypothetical protein